MYPPVLGITTGWPLSTTAPRLGAATFRGGNLAADGAKALAWLKTRGLREGAIRRAQLGYVPGHWSQYHSLHGLTVASGILIPWWHKNDLWGIKVRLSGGDKKYTQVKGGNIPGSIYWAAPPDHAYMTDWGVLPEWPLLIVEGEFDCLIVYQEAADLIIQAMERTFSQKIVTYDFARLMEGATEVKCSEFGKALIANMG